jgi:hypothetical protein
MLWPVPFSFVYCSTCSQEHAIYLATLFSSCYLRCLLSCAQSEKVCILQTCTSILIFYKFLESKCPGGGDMHQFLDELHAKCDELSAVGVQIEEKDYWSMIIQSLSNHLASFASGQLATARLYSPTQTIAPDILISLIIEESE